MRQWSIPSLAYECTRVSFNCNFIESQMEQIQRTSGLLKDSTYLFNFSQMISSLFSILSLFNSSCVYHLILFCFFFSFFFAAERIISLEKKESYNLYIQCWKVTFSEKTLNSGFGKVVFVWLRWGICSCHLQLWSQGFGKEGYCHIAGLSMFESTVIKVCNWSRRTNA